MLSALTGASSLRWLNVETPLVRNLRVDLLGETADGELIHIELQSKNDATFPLRMGEYSFAVALRHGRLPRQVALYVGSDTLRIKNEIEGPGGVFRFHLTDIRELDGELLLASKNPGDNVIALLTRLGREPDAVRRVLDRIAAGPSELREEALAELSIIAGLRKLGEEVKRETRNMPIQESIMDHDSIGPLLLQAQMEMLAGQIEERFGSISPRVRAQLAALPHQDLKIASLRLVKARCVEDMFER